jgi:hypothetical protein
MTSTGGDAPGGASSSSSSGSDGSSLASFGAALEEELAQQAHNDVASAPVSVAPAPAPADSGGEPLRKRPRDDEAVEAAGDGAGDVRAPGACAPRCVALP